MSILILPAPVVNLDLSDPTPVEEYRPTFDPSYYPTLAEERDARELFDDSDDAMADDDPRWDELADDAYAMDRVCLGTSWL